MSGPRPAPQHSASAVSGPPAPARPQRSRPAHAVAGSHPVTSLHAFERGSPPHLLTEFVQILLSNDEERAMKFVLRLLDSGTSPEAVYEDLFTPAARLLGELWEKDDCSFYEVTVGSGRIQRLVRDLSHRFLADQAFPGSSGRILLGCAHGEQHSLGVAMLAEYFARDGWDVHMNSGLGSEGLLDKVRESDYNIVGLSVSGAEKATRLKREIQMVRQMSRNRDIKILIGGYIISSDPSIVRRVGADGHATDAASAVREAKRLMNHS